MSQQPVAPRVPPVPGGQYVSELQRRLAGAGERKGVLSPLRDAHTRAFPPPTAELAPLLGWTPPQFVSSWDL